MRIAVLLLLQFLTIESFAFSKETIDKWEKTASNVTIIRDKWGIPHIYGKTDADCVFGLLYAQCEDDFQRVEMNYITMLGRTTEIKGKDAIYEDLLVKMVIDSADAVNDYNHSPIWLKKLLNAFADGVNYYLYTHPNVKPAALKEFKPWYPLMYTDGSISAIQTSGLTGKDIKAFYDGLPIDLASLQTRAKEDLIGSNGFAISPMKSSSGNAMLYINPHVTFYFRPEVHMVSEEGLNAYGAVTWGQFFVYQGFNEHLGWMHTSSSADVADLYEETIIKSAKGLFYKYDNEIKPVKTTSTEIYVKTASGFEKKSFPIYFTKHGPILSSNGDKWISLQSNNRSLNALIQSWKRTKAKNFEEFKSIMDLRQNVSNNTVYADDKGNIAYWHGNFMPRRDTNYNYSGIVDGSTSKTDWKGLHTVNETIHLYNPGTGFLQNCNSTPFTAAGPNIISKKDYPAYMAPDAENFRGINAVRLFNNKEKLDLNELMKKGYDTYLSAFDILLPALFEATNNKQLTLDMNEALSVLKAWNKKADAESIATTIGILWSEKILPLAMKNRKGGIDLTIELPSLLNNLSAETKLTTLQEVINKLVTDFGTWKLSWGQLNRFQRIDNGFKLHYDDAQPSIPSGLASSAWGCLPSFNSRTFDTKLRYGYGGNSFICAVEFGKKVKAKSLLAGGESGDPTSPHFKDQAAMYLSGQFKDVSFYYDDVLKNLEEKYHPGKRN
jgi:acyl-homoserine lactone acylase PvdQ